MGSYDLSCVRCGVAISPVVFHRVCSACGGELAFWKWEGANPTGAQKDRGLDVAIAKGRAIGFEAAIIASTGSAGLSSAAYAARAGMKHAVLVSRNAPAARVMPMIGLGYEIFLQHGSVPDWIVVPVGGGGTLGSIWRAFQDLRTIGFIDRMPRMVGVLTGSGHRETHVLTERGEASVEVITTADGEARLARFLGEPQSIGEAVA